MCRRRLNGRLHAAFLHGVAGHLGAVQCLQLRALCRAAGIGMRAARVEGAAGGWVQWVGHLALHGRAGAAGVFHLRNGELVTLMTLGAQPELLVLGYLRNQRLVQSVSDIESITVDWDVGAAAVKTCSGIDQIEERTARRVVTTGCGQGSVFGDLMADIDTLVLPPATLSQAQLYGIVNAIRLQESTYKSAGNSSTCCASSATNCASRWSVWAHATPCLLIRS